MLQGSILCLIVVVVFSVILSEDGRHVHAVPFSSLTHEERSIPEGVQHDDSVGERSDDCFRSTEVYSSGTTFTIEASTDNACNEAGIFVSASEDDCACGSSLSSCPGDFQGHLLDEKSLSSDDTTTMQVTLTKESSLFITMIGKTVHYCSDDTTTYSFKYIVGTSSTAVILGVVIGAVGVFLIILVIVFVVVLILCVAKGKRNRRRTMEFISGAGVRGMQGTDDDGSFLPLVDEDATTPGPSIPGVQVEFKDFSPTSPILRPQVGSGSGRVSDAGIVPVAQDSAVLAASAIPAGTGVRETMLSWVDDS